MELSQGAVELAYVIAGSEEPTQRSLALSMECHETYIGQLLKGRRKPGRSFAARLEREYGIELESWDEPAESDEMDEALQLLSEKRKAWADERRAGSDEAA